MNFNKLKRKTFFLLDKLQISRTERIAFTLIFTSLAMLFLANQFLQDTYNYSQERYDEIIAEFEKKSALIHQQQKENEKRYFPVETVEKESQIIEVATEPDDIVEDSEPSPQIEKVKAEPAEPEFININSADAEQLKTLKGVGDATARNIIEYREEHGNFQKAEDLLKVKGIGEKRLENIKAFIVFN